MFDLTNKLALVTGGGSGIGRAISLVLAMQGAKVIILDMDEAGAKETVTAIDGNALYKILNVSDAKAVKETIDTIVTEYGTPDIVVNNAGIAHIGTAETTSEEDFDKVIAVNIKGVFNMAKAVIPHMKEKGGVILNMSSIASSLGIPDRFAYSMSKGAVAAMTLSIAKDYLPYHIRCNCISPARVHTPFVDGFIAKNYPGREEEMFAKLSATQPIGRMAKPEEIAKLALYLCSDESSFITGGDYPIDGGFLKLNN